MSIYGKYVFFIEAGLLIDSCNNQDRQWFFHEWTGIILSYAALDKMAASSCMPIGILEFMKTHPEKSFIDAVKELAPRYKDAYKYPHIEQIVSIGEEAIPLIKKKRLETLEAYKNILNMISFGSASYNKLIICQCQMQH